MNVTIDRSKDTVTLSRNDFNKLVNAGMDLIDGKRSVELHQETGLSLTRCEEIKNIIMNAYQPSFSLCNNI